MARRDSTFSYDEFVNCSIEELRSMSFKGGGAKTPGIWRDNDGKLRDKFGQVVSSESGNKEGISIGSIKMTDGSDINQLLAYSFL